MIRLITSLALAASLILPAAAQDSRREEKIRAAVETLNKGIEALRANDAATAVELITKSIDSGRLKDENLRIAHFSRGAGYSMLDRCPDAIPDFTIAIEMKADDAQVFAQRGACYDKTKQAPAAIADLKQAVALAPTEPAYATFLCAVAFNGKVFAESGPACEAAVRTFDPKNKEFVQASAQSYEAAGNKPKANEMWKMLLSLDPASEAAKQGIARTK
jgi:tetratricopeptide (TPR) repeat protein